MSDEIILDAITFTLRTYLSYDDSYIEFLLNNPNVVDKQRIETIDHLEVIIYPNDHNPPHFHVKSKDLKIDAKFLIETGEFYKGEISSKDIKKIKAFYQSSRGKNLMEIIWKKYQN
jgi:hypothetical protein